MDGIAYKDTPSANQRERDSPASRRQRATASSNRSRSQGPSTVPSPCFAAATTIPVHLRAATVTSHRVSYSSMVSSFFRRDVHFYPVRSPRRQFCVVFRSLPQLSVYISYSLVPSTDAPSRCSMCPRRIASLRSCIRALAEDHPRDIISNGVALDMDAAISTRGLVLRAASQENLYVIDPVAHEDLSTEWKLSWCSSVRTRIVEPMLSASSIASE